MKYSMLKKVILFITILLGTYWLLTVIYSNISEKTLREYEKLPTDSSWNFQTISLKSNENNKLTAWKISGSSADSSAPVLLYLHGSGGNVSHYLSKYNLLRQISSFVFALDYRGYGESEGVTDPAGIVEDSKTMINYLINEEKIRAENIILYGHHMGVYPALTLAEEFQVRGVVIEGGFTSVRELLEGVYSMIPEDQIRSRDMDNLILLENLNLPLLFIHSRENEVVPFSHGEKLYSVANAPKDLLALDHGDDESTLTANWSQIKPVLQGFAR